MKLPEELKKFLNKWARFLGIILSPGSVIPLILASVSLSVGFNHNSNLSLTILLSVAASILTAISGFFIKDDWDKFQGNNMLEKKGLSALRNLESISTQLCNLKEWVLRFQKDTKKIIDQKSFEEINRHISNVQLNISSSLADWADLSPELKKEREKAKEEAQKYEDVVRAYQEELLKAKKEMLAISNDAAQKKEVEEKIKKLESEIKDLRRDQNNVLNSSFASPSIIGGPSGYQSFGLTSTRKFCQRCGRLYEEDPTSISILPLSLCNNCKNL